MFGRVRAASSSLDSLERPPSKIFKDDPLSIYETTLIKLKLGSQRDLNSPSPSEEAGEEMESDCSTITVSTSCVEQPIFSTSTIISETSQLLVTSIDGDAMAIDTDSSSASACQSTGDSKQRRITTMPLLYLFSKYNASPHHLSSSDRELTGAVSYDSATTSPTFSNCRSSANTEEHESRTSSSERLM